MRPLRFPSAPWKGLVASCATHWNFARATFRCLVKRRRLILETHSRVGKILVMGLTKSFKFKEMLINLEREVGLVEGLDTNQLSWLRSFLFQLQSEEGENHDGDPWVSDWHVIIWIFERFLHDTGCSTKETFVFWLVCERHFAEEFDDLEWPGDAWNPVLP